ncbi:MAG: hypothetical protein HQL82_09720 [Magnetococcales bacterium]|nr:hypothetical protein [Magnetococcales bacterium]
MTTIDIDETLVHGVQQLARQRNLTLQQVVESALQSFLEHERQQEGCKAFHLRKRSFRGHGLHPDIQEEGNWETLRRRIYEDQGA